MEAIFRKLFMEEPSEHLHNGNFATNIFWRSIMKKYFIEVYKTVFDCRNHVVISSEVLEVLPESFFYKPTAIAVVEEYNRGRRDVCEPDKRTRISAWVVTKEIVDTEESVDPGE